MLNVFPDLLTYQLLAPFILRVVLGLILLNLGYLKLGAEKTRWETSFETLRLQPKEVLVKLFGFIEILGGIALIAGFYTQVAALVFAVITFIELYIEQKEAALLKRDFVFYLLLFAIALSLLLTGAGFFAFDLPL
ncbi:MAG TPA: DoxX family protein [Candidatus Paceibacterota bacterium]